jgi:hypothetical protein
MKISTWAAVTGLAVVALYFLMPQERLDGIADTLRRTKGDPGQACLDFEGGNLKDSASARLLTTSTADGLVTITYKAKNSYGAYGQSTSVCAVDASGRVSDSATRAARMKTVVDQNSLRMDEAIACLKRRIEVRRELKRQGSYLGEDDKSMGAACPAE